MYFVRQSTGTQGNVTRYFIKQSAPFCFVVHIRQKPCCGDSGPFALGSFSTTESFASHRLRSPLLLHRSTLPIMTSPTETSPLISAVAHNSASDGLSPTEAQGSVVLSRKQLWGLYFSHFLSTWNARGYEFAAVCQMVYRGLSEAGAERLNRYFSRRPLIRTL
jgi:hypothetical protein